MMCLRPGKSANDVPKTQEIILQDFEIQGMMMLSASLQWCRNKLVAMGRFSYTYFIRG